MRTLDQTIRQAQIRARANQSTRFILYEDGNYYIAPEHELDTYWAGAPILYAVSPDGEVSSAH